MEQKSISIIMPVFNKEKYITDILNDIRWQSMTDFECLVVDDGSTDQSGLICDEIAKTDSRFRVFHKSNGGVSSARNFGLDRMNGKYVTFIDADDRIHPDYLKNMYDIMVRNGVDLVIGGIEKVWGSSDKRESVSSVYHGSYYLRDILSAFADIQLKTGIFGFCFAKLIRAELIEDVRFDENLTLAEDFDFYLRVYKKVETIYFDPASFYYYLQEAENSSALIRDDAIDYFAQLRIMLRYRDFLKELRSYSSENREIVDQRLSDYVFFTAFYCCRTEMKATLSNLYSVVRQEGIELHGRTLWQKWILFTLKHQLYFMTKSALLVYDIARKVLRRGERR